MPTIISFVILRSGHVTVSVAGEVLNISYRIFSLGEVGGT